MRRRRPGPTLKPKRAGSTSTASLLTKTPNKLAPAAPATLRGRTQRWHSRADLDRITFSSWSSTLPSQCRRRNIAGWCSRAEAGTPARPGDPEDSTWARRRWPSIRGMGRPGGADGGDCTDWRTAHAVAGYGLGGDVRPAFAICRTSLAPRSPTSSSLVLEAGPSGVRLDRLVSFCRSTPLAPLALVEVSTPAARRRPLSMRPDFPIVY